MTQTFARVTRRTEFDNDFKKLLKKFRSLEEDLATFEKTQLVLLHKHKLDNGGIVQIIDLSSHIKFFKVVKFACKSLPGRGAASGIRIIYAYFEADDHIEYIEMYFKADQEKEDRSRIKSLYKI